MGLQEHREAPGRAGAHRVRLWSIHPKHLDAKGLVAFWREAPKRIAVTAGQVEYEWKPFLAKVKAGGVEPWEK